MLKDLVSVVMPTYNDSKYLDEAVEDILSQTYENFELIIVNDGSTDDTAQKLSEYQKKDNRIKVLHKENGGTGSALNLGFQNAVGEFGTWVSSDDRKEKNFLQVLVEFLKNNRDIEYVSSAFYSTYLGKIFKPFYIKQETKSFTLCLDGKSHDDKCTGMSLTPDNWAEVNSYQCFQGVCFMFTMRLKNKCGDYIQIPGEDYHMCMKMALNSRVGYIDLNLGTHKNPPDSLSMENRNCVVEANLITRNLYNSSKKWNLSKIPKVANFYWGSDKMSFMRYQTIKSFKLHNPDWSIHLYVPSKVVDKVSWRDLGGDTHHKSDTQDYVKEENYYDKLLEEEAIKVIKVDFSKSFLGAESSEVHRCDFLRWMILSKNGGLWSDMDILYFKSLSEMNINTLENSACDTILCYDDRESTLVAPIGFILSSKNNKLFLKAAELSKIKYNPKRYQCLGTETLTSMGIDYRDIVKSNRENNILNLDPKTVYYYDFKKLENVYEQNNIEVLLSDTSSIGVHWYGGHPMTQKYNNLINDKNYYTFNNTITKIIELNDEK